MCDPAGEHEKTEDFSQQHMHEKKRRSWAAVLHIWNHGSLFSPCVWMLGDSGVLCGCWVTSVLVCGCLVTGVLVCGCWVTRVCYVAVG